MVKFSIIVPVYNTEEYLERCIESILKQTFEDFEIILINDGSTDNSKKIIADYQKQYPEKIKVVNKKNGGLSSARNKGVSKAKGEYILFVDSDDYIEKGLLKTLNTKTKDCPDLIRFQIKEIRDNKICMHRELPFETVKGDKAFKKIIKYHYVETAWCYAYRREFYKKNKFSFSEGKYHEDFGLIPYVIMCASKVKSIGYVGYNYVIRSGSIMTEVNYEKNKKKAEDFLYHYKNLVDKMDNSDCNNIDVYKSFLANSAILKSLELNSKDYKNYVKALRNLKVFNNLLHDTWQRKVKKIGIRLSPRLYYKVVR